jgi:hypothetical protein
MKQRIILFYTLLCNITFCFSQPKYFIQTIYDGCNILIVFTNDNNKNMLLINDILNDSLICKVTSMVVDGNFSQFPSNFHKINWIKEMQLSSKKPFIIDNQFSCFNKLKSLIVLSKIQSIDQSVQFSNLESIQFQHSELKAFPLAICFWDSLKQIDIQDCDFGILPKEIGNLQQLEILNLSNDNILLLPEEFYFLPRLKTIGLSNNSLTSISFLICDMENLEWICLDNNANLKLTKTIKDCLSDILQTVY